MVTVNVQVANLPHRLVTPQATVLVPIGNTEPDGGLQPDANEPEQQKAPETAGAKLTTAEH